MKLFRVIFYSIVFSLFTTVSYANDTLGKPFFNDTFIVDSYLNKHILLNTDITLNKNEEFGKLNIEFWGTRNSLLYNAKLLTANFENQSPIGISNTDIVEEVLVENDRNLDLSVNTFDRTNEYDGASEILDATGDISIVKFYIMTDDVTDISVPLSYYVVKNNISKINIIDEQSYNNFKLIDWFTSTSDWVPMKNQNSISYDYEAIKEKYFDGQTGEEPGSLDLSGTNEKTLYLLYDYEPISTSFSIVKIFKDNDEIENIDTITLKDRPKKNIYNSDEAGYKLESYIVSESTVQDISGVSDISTIGEVYETDESDIKVDVNCRTLYLIYDKLRYGKLVLSSNELSHKYSLSDLVGKVNLLSIYDYIPSAVEGKAYSPLCNGHTCDNPDCDVYHMCNTYEYGSKKLDPKYNSWRLHVVDNFDYNTTTFIRDYKVSNNMSREHLTDWQGGNGADAQIIPDASFILYRQSDADKITLYPNKNDELKSELLNIGLDIDTDSSYIPYSRRYAQETYTDESFTNTLTTHWETGWNNKSELKWIWKIWCDYGEEESSGVYSVDYEIGHSPDDLNSLYSVENNIEEYYYIGKSAESDDVPEDMRKYNSIDYTDYILKASPDKLKFYPYYGMKLETIDGGPHIVYVTSENESILQPYDVIQVGGFKRKSNQVNSSKFFFGTTENLSDVLVEHILDNISEIEYSNQLNINMFIPCIEDENLNSLSNFSFNRKRSETYALINDNIDNILGQNDFSFIDQTKDRITKTLSIYSVHANIEGEYWIEKDGTLIGEKSKSLDTLLLNSEIKWLDDNTKLLTNMYNVLEHSENTLDNDGNPWYYEVFDGLDVLFLDFSVLY